MLFNSYSFLLVFLPITLVVYWCLVRVGSAASIAMCLVGASLFFYGWWNPPYLVLILGSILINYLFGRVLSGSSRSRGVLALGVGFNLVLIAYFKYASFFAANVGPLFGMELQVPEVVLPLAISFFTFQQIAYLVDVWKDGRGEANLLDYSLFVTFFPQLIAGPIVHHKEMLPQFKRGLEERVTFHNVVVGLSILFLGLFKKVVLADGAASFATPIFDSADGGATVDLVAGWVGALGYTFQIYFDFSGYSDMAIGLAKMFGICLPLNFFSPYKAVNIVEFWRRWHMTLSRFLRDYLYIPLGGNRKGPVRRYVNLMATMLLGGLWHGAGWTFVVWGGLHGGYLAINHLWRSKGPASARAFLESSIVGRNLAWGITFLAVVLAWVLFRATTLQGSIAVIEGMIGLHGFRGELPVGAHLRRIFAFFLMLGLAVRFLPNTAEIFAMERPTIEEVPPLEGRLSIVRWSPTLTWALICSGLALASFYSMTTSGYHEFIYRFF